MTLNEKTAKKAEETKIRRENVKEAEISTKLKKQNQKKCEEWRKKL